MMRFFTLKKNKETKEDKALELGNKEK